MKAYVPKFRKIYLTLEAALFICLFVSLNLGSVVAQLPSSPDPRAALWPVELRCEGEFEPLGVDKPNPRLSWNLEGDGLDRRQTAFRILVATSLELLQRGEADLWDSKRIRSDEMTHIEYAGKPLPSSSRIYWKVMVWDEKGRPGPWSLPASWVTGLLPSSTWTAKWIGIADTNAQTALLRYEFELKPGFRSAILHVCGLGHFEPTINGKKITDAVLMPGWSKYDRTCLYETFDVTPYLNPGTNAIGLFLGNGMYRVLGGRYKKFKGSFGPLQAIAQLHIRYTNGHEEVIISSENWKGRAGPITFSCVYGGEDYDARLYPTGWDEPGYQPDSLWHPVVVHPGPGGKLLGHSASAPPIKIIETLKPTSIKRIETNAAIYDFGQNASIMVRLVCQGPAGSKIRMTPAELLGTNNMIDRRSCGGGHAWWEYTLSGTGREKYVSKFFYHGARYIFVERIPAPGDTELPAVISLEALVIHSTAEPVGDFACSNELLNRIRQLVRWAQRSNMMSVLTDCPHREKLGWLEQYHLNGPALRYEFRIDRIIAKGMNDMRDSQLPNGMIPTTAPEYVVFGKDKNDISNPFRNSPEWGSAFIIVPWQQYLFTGDDSLIREYFPEMKKYMAFLQSQTTNWILNLGLGDWYDLGPKPPGYGQLTGPQITATAIYFHDAELMSKFATTLGAISEAKMYSELAKKIHSAFNAYLFDPTNKWYGTGSQTAQAMALALGLCPESIRKYVYYALTNNIVQNNYMITAGDVGFRFLIRALADDQQGCRLLYRVLNETNNPGYGYQLAKGATSLTEAWDARPTSSQNHFMLGQIIEWFYHDLAGIQPDEANPGFKRVLIQPVLLPELQWVFAKYKSVRGEIISAWRRKDDSITLRVKIPHNSTALVTIPNNSPKNILLNGIQAIKSPYVHKIIKMPNASIFLIGSGEYQFIFQELPTPQR